MRKKASRPRHARMLGAATRGTKKEPTGLFFVACGRPCSFDSSYGLHETATTLDIPSRWDPRANQSPTGALVAVLRIAALFDSRMGQIKNALAQCAKTATTLDIPSCWDPRANQSPTGALVAVLRTAALSRVVVPSVCFTPWSGVRIPLTTAPASLPCFRRWQRSAQLQFPYESN